MFSVALILLHLASAKTQRAQKRTPHSVRHMLIRWPNWIFKQIDHHIVEPAASCDRRRAHASKAKQFSIIWLNCSWLQIDLELSCCAVCTYYWDVINMPTYLPIIYYIELELVAPNRNENRIGCAGKGATDSCLCVCTTESSVIGAYYPNICSLIYTCMNNKMGRELFRKCAGLFDETSNRIDCEHCRKFIKIYSIAHAYTRHTHTHTIL